MSLIGLALLAALGYGAFFLDWDETTFITMTIGAAVFLVAVVELIRRIA